MAGGTPRTSQGYWAIVRRQFRRRRLAILGLWVVGVFFVVALLAPLLANDRPIIARYHGHLRFPAFTNYLDASPLPPWLISSLRKAMPGWLAPVYPELEGKTWKEAMAGEEDDADKNISLWMSGEWGWALMPPVPHSYRGVNPTLVKKKPGDPALAGRKHLLGTDNLGRDVLARMIYGTIVAMSVGVLSVAIYCTLGIIIGALAGYFGGWVDLSISRVIEIVICFPTLFLILAVVSVFGNSIYWIIILLGVIRWTGPARLIRGEFLKAKTADYAMAARALGLPPTRIIFRHLTPNCLAPVLVTATFGVAGAILIESSLSFLGFGVSYPMASWGEVGRQGQMYVSEGMWHLILFPGLSTFVTVTAFNLVGEGLRDAMDPRLRGA